MPQVPDTGTLTQDTDATSPWVLDEELADALAGIEIPEPPEPAADSLTVLNVSTFGAEGDNVVDDTSSIQDALDEAATNGLGVYFPPGIYKVTSELELTRGTRLFGAGHAIDSAGSLSQPYEPASKIRSTTTGTVISAVNLNGLQIRDLAIESATASCGLQLDQILGGVFKNLFISTTATAATGLLVSASDDAGNNTSYCTFEHINITAPKGLRVTGSPTPTRNVCLNHFNHVTVSGNTANTVDELAIYLHNGDNNVFTNLRVFHKPANPNYSTQFGPRFRDNTFVHMQAGDGGLYVEAPELSAIQSNAIWTYTTGNAMPAPVLETGANLTWYQFGDTDGHSFNVHGRKAQFDLRALATSEGALYKSWGTDSGGTAHLAQFGMNDSSTAEIRVSAADPLVISTDNTERLKVHESGHLTLNAGPHIHTGAGSPNSVVTAPIGSVYLQTDGVVGQTHWVKENGSSNIGWCVTDSSPVYERLLVVGGRGTTSGASATTYMMTSSNTADATAFGLATEQAASPFHVGLVLADLTIPGKQPQIRISGTVFSGNTAIGQTVTFGLYPLTIVVGAVTAGTVVAGSTAAVTNPGANTIGRLSGSDFDLPANGSYCLGYTLGGTPTGNFGLQARLEVHWV